MLFRVRLSFKTQLFSFCRLFGAACFLFFVAYSIENFAYSANSVAYSAAISPIRRRNSLIRRRNLLEFAYSAEEFACRLFSANAEASIRSPRCHYSNFDHIFGIVGYPNKRPMSPIRRESRLFGRNLAYSAKISLIRPLNRLRGRKTGPH